MVVSELNRRLAWLKVTVCLVLPWLWLNHNVAPGNRMSPWPCANLRICASPTSNQELKNWCVGSLSPPCPVSFSCFFRCLSHPYFFHLIHSVWRSCLPDVLNSVAFALYPLLHLSFCSTSSLTKMTLGAYKNWAILQKFLKCSHHVKHNTTRKAWTDWETQSAAISCIIWS